MTNALHRFALVLATASALGACGGAPVDAGNGNGGTSNGEIDLFPLTVGNSWTYNITVDSNLAGQKTQTVLRTDMHPDAEGEVFVLESLKPSGSRTVSYQQKRGGDTVRYVEEIHKASGGPPSSEVYTPYKLRVWNDALVVGEQRVESYSENSKDPDGIITGEFAKTEEWVVGAIESVTVPAGTFDDAVRIHRTTVTTATEKTYWFAPGVGKIREVGKGQTEELESFTVQ